MTSKKPKTSHRPKVAAKKHKLAATLPSSSTSTPSSKPLHRKSKTTETSRHAPTTVDDSNMDLDTEDMISGGNGMYLGPLSAESNNDNVPPKASEEDDAKAGEQPKALTEFRYFTFLPAEIQQRIFMEAMRKPNVHFTEIRRVKTRNRPNSPPSTTWTISMHPVNGSADTSSYRQLRNLASVCPAAAKAVYFGTEGKHRLPFAGLPSAGVDTRHDLVVVDLKPKDAVENIMAGFGPWHPLSFGAAPTRLDVGHARTLLRGIANVGFPLPLTGTLGCFSSRAPFRSLLRVNDHADFNMCPEELSGFLDLFPDLETVYLVAILSRKRGYVEDGNWVRSKKYSTTFFNLTSTERTSMDLAMFHDSQYTYIEYRHDSMGTDRRYDLDMRNCEGDVWGFSSYVERFVGAVKEAYTADGHPTIPIPVVFQNSFAQRSSIKFKVLIKAH